jgi:hypothetical protein
VSSGPCSGHVGACAGPYPRGNAGREGEGWPHGQARGHPGEATRRRKGRSQGATGRMPLPLAALLPVPAAYQVSCGRACHRRLPEAGACLQLVAGKRLCLPSGDSGAGRGARGPTRQDRVPAPPGDTGGSSRTNPVSVPWTSTKRPSPVQTTFMSVSALTSSSSWSSGRSTPLTMPTLTAATVLVSGWASDPTVSRTIEALAADAPATLKAIGTTAPAKARAVVSGREMGQPRIAVVSRVNWRWPISL